MPCRDRGGVAIETQRLIANRVHKLPPFRRKLVPIMEKVVDLQEKAVSMQESTLDTLNRVKGTTDFVTEEVAAPIISVYGTVAKGRMMMKTVTGRDKGSERKTTAKLLK